MGLRQGRSRSERGGWTARSFGSLGCHFAIFLNLLTNMIRPRRRESVVIRRSIRIVRHIGSSRNSNDRRADPRRGRGGGAPVAFLIISQFLESHVFVCLCRVFPSRLLVPLMEGQGRFRAEPSAGQSAQLTQWSKWFFFLTVLLTHCLFFTFRAIPEFLPTSFGRSTCLAHNPAMRFPHSPLRILVT